MTVEHILAKARSLGVRLRVEGEIVKIAGPSQSVAEIKPEIAAHKAEVLAYLRGSGEFWPWAPYLNADDVHRFRAELVETIEKLAAMEQWPDMHRDDVLARAIRGPLADLLPNLHHFNQRLTEAIAGAAAREAVEKRTWRFNR
ncbi:TubC N-terminal docking domain-related protein [Paraburkholderia kirstenboschensis]|uniref:TubC N-terminal docking domain-containing protein n=1 Tax=Paraburkholderia kirstenboschensis TaxID=1245436 RepID=A0ABZ0ERU3_9BURK|nr:hypothetical protein [Paraburkholderia kirstenboschensis]WOD18967.1 hypothetical protein RW095_40555 [Paraburkholderia kirstenboschensis]